ncbi:MAG: aminodeoxychorismate synthase component I [Campylobacterota bacterium]|nr:aminodeoxychorismate synthase component I [Campylobacterota bacterium]
MTFDTLSTLASQNIPFLFYTDFKGEKLHVYPLNNLINHGIEYAINKTPILKHKKIELEKNPISYQKYKIKFDKIISKIEAGETYLLNLTQPTEIKTNLSLDEIFQTSQATYKLHVKNKFVCFSPEPFITIEENTISTYPMKGTIDASIRDAEKKILSDKKEMAEHVMVVDLLRNDIAIVAKNIEVEKFRFVQKINAGNKELLQVSSKIKGTLQNNWKNNLGNIIKTLLPAGSISGTPKLSTLRIIEDTEEYNRDYYTGVFGVFDGKKLETSVMIRFIEIDGNKLIYKSGGGITLDSNSKEEYQELIDKVYIP